MRAAAAIAPALEQSPRTAPIRLGAYTTEAGAPRILVALRGRVGWTVFDLGTLKGARDARWVEGRLRDWEQVEGVAKDYLAQARSAGRSLMPRKGQWSRDVSALAERTRIAAYDPVKDEDPLFELWSTVVREAGVVWREPEIDRSVFRDQWVAGCDLQAAHLDDGGFVGGYALRPRQGLGHHASASYIVSKPLRSRGFGRALAEHSFARAKELGYEAVALEVLARSPGRGFLPEVGFAEVGRIPNACGRRSAFMYWREID